MFFIWDRNHRVKAWTRYIDRLYSDDREWYYSVDIICLDTEGKGGLFLNAMHDINKSIEYSHMKTNMVYTLHQIRVVESMRFDNFKNLFTEEEFRKCASNLHLRKAWFMLISEIAEASSDVARKYYDEIPKKERNDTKVSAVMKAAAKTKWYSFKGQFSKYTVVANLKFRDEFFEEVSASFSVLRQFILNLYCYKIDIPSLSFRS